MSRSINSIWQEFAARQLDCEVPDHELNMYVAQLKQSIKELRESAEGKLWQAHYDAALNVCRLSRRVRFRLADLGLSEFDFRSKVHPLLSDAYDLIRTDEQVEGVTYTVKKLNDIRENVHHRLNSIEGDHTSFLDDEDKELDVTPQSAGKRH
jgi:hypothetical protein